MDKSAQAALLVAIVMSGITVLFLGYLQVDLFFQLATAMLIASFITSICTGGE